MSEEDQGGLPVREGEVMLRARCHPLSVPLACLGPDGVIRFRCLRCGRDVASFELKDPPPAECNHRLHEEEPS